LIDASGVVVTKGSISGPGNASLATSSGLLVTGPALAVRVGSIDADSCDTLANGKGAVHCIAFIAPVAGGTIEISATGGGSLPTAGQVKVTATATVTDSGAAALAAVQALATTVASLRTLITTLTNLVLKIQKKVKA